MSEPDADRPRFESASFYLFRALAPRIPRIPSPEPPERLYPYETVIVPRPGREDAGALEGSWFPASTSDPTASREARGAVLLMHPWFEWGRAYFHRRGRIDALRAAGYHVLTVDLPGFGGSGEARGFYDRDAEDALSELARRASSETTGEGVPLHVWGVSSGGYWLHPVLVRWNRDPDRPPVLGAVFEDVSSHLLRWSWRTARWGRPFYCLFRLLFPGTYRFLDLRRHAPRLGVRSAAYISGEHDRGVRPEETRELARRAGGEAMIVPNAWHLEGIKLAKGRIIDLALDLFRKAEESTGAPRVEGVPA